MFHWCPRTDWYHSKTNFFLGHPVQTIYFLKALDPRISKLILPSVSYKNTQIQIHKYTNTQIKHMTKYQKDPTCWIFLKRGLFKDIKNDISINQTCKYKNTNTQIHKYSIWQRTRKPQHVVYFWKEECSRISKMIFPWIKHANKKIQIHKYKYDKVSDVVQFLV